MKDNSYRKEFGIDRFARKYYCQHARLNQLRDDKHKAKKTTRLNSKKTIDKESQEWYNNYSERQEVE